MGTIITGAARRRHWGASCAAAALAALAFAAGARAQEADDAETEESRDVITVYGTSNPLPVFAYPGQVSVISREDIEVFAPSAVSDMLRDVPGLEFSGGPRRTGETPSLRGLGRENVLILLDGARQSFTSAHDGQFFIDPELLRTAEVVRGPASALYGSGASGGVLAFESADAADFLDEGETAGVRFRLGYQDVNEEYVAAVTGFARVGRLDALASFGMRDSGDIALGSGADLASDDDIDAALVKAGVSLTDALAVELSWQRFANTAIEPNNGQGVIPSSDPVLGRDVEKDIASDTYRFGATFNPASSDLIDAAFNIYRTETSVDEFDASVPRATLRDIETTGVSLRNAARFSIGGVDAVLTIGGDWYEDEQVGRDDEAADDVRAGVPNGQSEFYGVFAQLEAAIERPFGLPGELLIIPGVRYDSFENSVDAGDVANDDSATSPRLGVSYGPVDWLQLFASYSEGFRAPSINELYLDGTHFSVPHPILFDPSVGSFVFVDNEFVPNPALTPEETETFEIGAGVDFHDVFVQGDRFTARGSYFESEVDDLINLSVDFAYDPSCFSPPFFPCSAGTTNSANVDAAELSGVEAEAVYETERLRVRASYSSIEGEDAATGADLGVLTPDRLNFDVRWRFPAARAAVGARAQLADDFERVGADDAGELAVAESRDGYASVDLYASWRPVFIEGLRLDVGVDNVFDEDYERVFEGVSEPGRNLRAAVSYTITR